MKVRRINIPNIMTDFVGFMQEKAVVQDGVYSKPKQYNIEEFEKIFEFVEQTDNEIYQDWKNNTQYHQYVAPVIQQKEQQNIDVVHIEETADKVVDVDKHKLKTLVTDLMEVRLKQPKYTTKDMEIIECKDSSISYRYKNVTILQIKGKRKISVYLTGKLLSQQLFEQFQHTPEKYKATHNAYLYINSVHDIELIMKAVDESMEQVDIKKG